MFTSYDTIWTTFLENSEMPDNELPKESEQIYPKIQNAILLFNNRMRTNINCVDESESVDVELTGDQLILLAQYIKLVFLKNKKLYRETLLNPFQKDIGFTHYTAQINSLRASVTEQEKLIEGLIINQTEDFL